MRISIVIPVHNGKEVLKQCLDPLINQNYSKKDYEIVVVNDASTDGTLDILRQMEKKAIRQNLSFSVVNLKKNKGRAIARQIGAKKAKYKRLFFVDIRCVAKKNILKIAKNISYQPLMGNVYMDPERSIFDRFFWLVRLRYYRSYFGRSFKRLKITKKNFDRFPKGTGIFLCNKELFLDSQFESGNYTMCSDDTRVLRNIVEKKPILKDCKLKAVYINRSNFMSNFKHIYERGPKFADYYLNSEGPFYRYYLFFLILIPFFFLVLFKYPMYTVSLFLIMVLVSSLISGFIFGTKKLSDFILVSLLSVPFGFIFLLGIIRARLFTFLYLSLIGVLLFYTSRFWDF